MDEKFTIDITPIDGGGLRVYIPELDISVETEGETWRDAEEAGLRAITLELVKRREQEASKAS